jgi:hypothetical protein
MPALYLGPRNRFSALAAGGSHSARVGTLLEVRLDGALQQRRLGFSRAPCFAGQGGVYFGRQFQVHWKPPTNVDFII